MPQTATPPLPQRATAKRFHALPDAQWLQQQHTTAAAAAKKEESAAAERAPRVQEPPRATVGHIEPRVKPFLAAGGLSFARNDPTFTNELSMRARPRAANRDGGASSSRGFRP